MCIHASRYAKLYSSIFCAIPAIGSLRGPSPPSVVFCNCLNNRLSGASYRNHFLPRRISVSFLFTRASSTSSCRRRAIAMGCRRGSAVSHSSKSPALSATVICPLSSASITGSPSIFITETRLYQVTHTHRVYRRKKWLPPRGRMTALVADRFGGRGWDAAGTYQMQGTANSSWLKSRPLARSNLLYLNRVFCDGYHSRPDPKSAYRSRAIGWGPK